jgi:hypothetical protein
MNKGTGTDSNLYTWNQTRTKPLKETDSSQLTFFRHLHRTESGRYFMKVWHSKDKEDLKEKSNKSRKRA